MNKLETFNPEHISVVTNAVAMAEELVSNFYKMSQREWLNNRYDVKTMKDLSPDEIVHGPFAQIIRYEGKKKDTYLGSSVYDFYKICLQDDSILSELKRSADMELFPFMLYVVTHELIHIVRFSKFLQHFNASYPERMAEEKRVHKKTNEILESVNITGLQDVLNFYGKWHTPFENIKNTCRKPLDNT